MRHRLTPPCVSPLKINPDIVYSVILALQYFAKSTNLDTHVPNVWGFLALINLKLGENYKAVECWKYAKIVRAIYIR